MQRAEIPLGLCQCGCGEATPIAKRTYGGKGIVAGRPVRYLTGHHRRKRDHYEIRDCGYETPCWVWTLSGNGHGYGRMKLWGEAGRAVQAHRWYYERDVGPIPVGLQLDHLCRNRACVNPAHMEPVTRVENVRRAPRNSLGMDRATGIRIARLTTTLSAREIAEMFGTTQSVAEQVIGYKTWRFNELKGKGSAEDAIRAARSQAAMSKEAM